MLQPKIGIFDLACCEGCQLQIVNMEEEILELLGLIRPVEWREAISDRPEPGERLDVAIVEGSVTREADAERLREIRARSKHLVALGACATIGGVNRLKNRFEMDDVRREVYGEAATMPHLETSPTQALHEVVDVDFEIHGCPIDAREFAHVIKCLLVNKNPKLPEHPVCVECKRNENVCRYEFGELCLGPLTRAGCDARCPGEGFWCFGCRGFVTDANTKAAEEVVVQYGKTLEDVQSKTALFNAV